LRSKLLTAVVAQTQQLEDAPEQNPTIAKFENEEKVEILHKQALVGNQPRVSFGRALEMMLAGAIMTRFAFGQDIYCRVQKPDENSTNTLPYIQMTKRIENGDIEIIDGIETKGYRIERFPVTLSVSHICI